MNQLEKAIRIAVEAHAGQTRRNGEPYIMHPLRMMCRLETEAERIVAVLHDVVEDTPWTLEQLKNEGFSPEVLQAVDALTKRDGEAYPDFVRRATARPLSTRVKLADLEDNMDVKAFAQVTEKDSERLNKYLRAWRYLKGQADAP